MASYHTRSFSFPSNSHPVASQVDQQLCRLRSSQAASTSSVTESLTGLVNLYKSVDEFLQLPQNQTTSSQNWVEKVLDGSLRLLDICSASKDVLVQSKENLQDMQSALRRNSNEFAQYQKSRKSAKKVVKKCLKDIKEVDETNESINATESMLKEVQAITVSIFKSLLSTISGSQKTSWSFSKLVHSKAEKETTPISKFDALDAALEKKSNIEMSQIVQLQTEVQEIEEVLESLFRHLIKTRATLLNVLSN